MDQIITKRWQLAELIPAEIEQNLSIYPAYVRQILYNRGITDKDQAKQFLDASHELFDPFQLTDMDRAVERLLTAIALSEPVAVYGDYDVDGVTATVLMVEVLESVGANVSPYIPNRFDEGYGLNTEALESLAKSGIRVVLTVDCGIRSNREADVARELGLDLIISDHHHPRNELPAAFAVVCPKREDDEYPDKNLAGVGLAYKLAQALLSKIPNAPSPVEKWLDLVALGTVADVVPLTGENRRLVREGLNTLRMGTRQGIVSLAGSAKIRLANLTASNIGFILAPRLNASGRMESALASFQLLASKDMLEAGYLAQKLDDQNRERQKQTQEMQQQADQQIQEAGLKSLVAVFDPNFNEGVIGLVAARLCEAYYRPAIVGRIHEGFIRASCRSIPEFHITRALDECADLFERHGGHAAAAGFSLREDRLPVFLERINAIADRELLGKELKPVLTADFEIGLQEMKPDRVLKLLEALQPTGAGNPEVTFMARNVQVRQYRPVGAEKQHVKLTLGDGRIIYDAIAFRQGHWLTNMPAEVDILFQLEKNSYNGQETFQLNIRDIRPAGAE